jgi:hypothetical protein
MRPYRGNVEIALSRDNNQDGPKTTIFLSKMVVKNALKTPRPEGSTLAE